MVIAGNNSAKLSRDEEIEDADGNKMKLSEFRLKRAQAIRDLLIKNGIKADQVKAVEGKYVPAPEGGPVPATIEIKNK